MITPILTAVHTRLFASDDLATEVGTRINYARAPVGTVYPQVIYFDVASRSEAVADYDKVKVQFSAWSVDKFQALRIQEIIYRLFLRYRGTIGDVEVNWTQLVDMAALPQDDPQLHGYQIRFELRVKGANIGD